VDGFGFWVLILISRWLMVDGWWISSLDSDELLWSYGFVLKMDHSRSWISVIVSKHWLRIFQSKAFECLYQPTKLAQVAQKHSTNPNTQTHYVNDINKKSHKKYAKSNAPTTLTPHAAINTTTPEEEANSPTAQQLDQAV
jgi:hypothetical protein